MDGLLPYFPRISFFVKALQKGEISVFQNMQYDKKWHVNRTVVPGSNGLITLSIPIVGGRNSKSRFDLIKLDNRYHWQRDHYRTLVSVYGSSPFFNFYEPDLKKLMDRPFDFLMEWNACCLEWVLSKLRLDRALKIQYHVECPSEFFQEEIQQKGKKLPIRDNLNTLFRYQQVFEDKIGFIEDLSVLDLLFNVGPDSAQKIKSSLIKL
jgi:hypothetical protein